jgi:hypothetical protein
VCVLAVLACTALSLCGCGLNAEQRTAVARFGTAAANLGAVAGEEFVRSRFDVIEMNTHRLGLGDRTVDAERLDGYFTMDDVVVRVEAAQALRSYGTLLSRLATGDEPAQIADASARLVASLQHLRTAGKVDITDERLGAIGRAVAEVGALAVEAERARAIREVIGASAPAVRRVAELLKQDFDPRGEHWSVGYEAVAVKLAERAANVRSDLGAAAPDRRAEWIAAESALAEAEALRGQCVQRFAEVSKRITAAADAMLLAEKDVRASLGTSPIGLDDLDAFTDQVAELITTYRILRK